MQCHHYHVPCRKLNQHELVANTTNTQTKRIAKHWDATSAFTYQTKSIFKSHVKIKQAEQTEQYHQLKQTARYTSMRKLCNVKLPYIKNLYWFKIILGNQEVTGYIQILMELLNWLTT